MGSRKARGDVLKQSITVDIAGSTWNTQSRLDIFIKLVFPLRALRLCENWIFID